MPRWSCWRSRRCALPGSQDLSIDLTVPSLAPAVLTGQGHEGATADAAREALDGKDAGELRGIVGDDPMIFGLLGAVGPRPRTALARLKALGISGRRSARWPAWR